MCVCVCAYLELGGLLHELLLLLAAAQRREDVEELLEEFQPLPPHTGDQEDGGDATHTHSHTHSQVIPEFVVLYIFRLFPVYFPSVPIISSQNVFPVLPFSKYVFHVFPVSQYIFPVFPVCVPSMCFYCPEYVLPVFPVS